MAIQHFNFDALVYFYLLQYLKIIIDYFTFMKELCTSTTYLKQCCID